MYRYEHASTYKKTYYCHPRESCADVHTLKMRVITSLQMKNYMIQRGNYYVTHININHLVLSRSFVCECNYDDNGTDTHTHHTPIESLFVQSLVLKRRTVHETNSKSKKHSLYFRKAFYILIEYTKICLCAKKLTNVNISQQCYR